MTYNPGKRVSVIQRVKVLYLYTCDTDSDTGEPEPWFDKAVKWGRNWFDTTETNCFILACVDTWLPDIPQISQWGFYLHVFLIGTAPARVTSLPRPATLKRLRRVHFLKASVERDGSGGETYGKRWKQRTDRWNICLWRELMEFPVEENNNDSSQCGEIRHRLLEKHSQVQNKCLDVESIWCLMAAYGCKQYTLPIWSFKYVRHFSSPPKKHTIYAV